MDDEAQRAGDPDRVEGMLLKRLLPAGEPIAAAELVEELGMWERPVADAEQRPHVRLNMVSSTDGRATLEGRSAGLSGAADRVLFHALRLAVDAVLVGAGTVRAERYGRLIADAGARELRQARGLGAEPLACVVTRSLTLGPGIPLLEDPGTRVVVLTSSGGELPHGAGTVQYIRDSHAGEVDLPAALGRLRSDFGVQSLLCEGGPHLAAQLLAGGLLDELFLSISPALVGGDPVRGAALRILAGEELRPPAALTLLGALESDSHLFLRYGVVAPERVSRETMLSSSLAS